jgi:hypothetical protein
MKTIPHKTLSDAQKPELICLKPTMSREEKIQGLLNYLRRRGIKVKPSPKPEQ